MSQLFAGLIEPPIDPGPVPTPSPLLTTWKATVTLPKAEAGKEYRLVIEEYEKYPAYSLDAQGAYLHDQNGRKRIPETHNRLVYADVLSITLPPV